MAAKNDSLLVRFRDRDSSEGISRQTMQKIARSLGLSETAALHRALAEYAKRHLPQYPRDDGPLTGADHHAIEAAVGDKFKNAKVIESFFDEEVHSDVKPSVSKRLSSPRGR